MSDWLSYYREAVKSGWKPPVYKATVTLQDKNKEQITIPFEGDYWHLLTFIRKYTEFKMTSSWRIWEDNKELDVGEIWELFEKIGLYA